MEALSQAQKFGPFSIHANLAKGGMADVLLATSEKAELASQLLAVKKLLPHLNGNKAFVNLLIHEAKIGVLLTHPNIVSVYDLGSHKSEFFIAMEYIHGKSIDQVFRAIKNSAIKTLPFELASYITMEIVRALAFAHDLKDNKGRELNIIHRDISPGNILLSYLGDVKLSDFGISTAEHRLQPFVTQNALGKIAYIPPEQALNDPAQRASDLYSLSVVYFQMITGNLPFDFKSLDDLVRGPADFALLNDQLKQKAPEIPAKLREFLAKCLNRSPKNRAQSASEYFHTLKEILFEELEVDYFARATRQYFKKKLAEFLKSVFEKDFESEKDILYRALNPNTEVVPEKTFYKAQDTGVFDMPTEATLLEEDIESEPTSVSNPALQANAKHDLATATSFEIPTISDSVISVEKKLKMSSLSRDHHENLKESLPEIEILSDADEDIFDVKTLGGVAPSKNLKTPVAVHRPFNLQNTKPVAIAKHNYSDSFPIYAEKLRKSFVTSVKFISFSILKVWMPIVAFAVALTVWLVLMRNETPSIPAFVPTQTIQVFVMGEAAQDQMEKFSTLLRGTSIDAFFNREYFRHTKSFQKVLVMNWSSPTLLNKKISTLPDLQPLLKSEKLFTFISENGGPKIESKSLSIILYLTPFDPENSSMPNITRAAFTKTNAPHILFVPAHPTQANQTSLLIAEEIARIFGATNKIDSSTGMPLFPTGYAEPDLKPLLPQTKAELMGEYIPVHSLKRRIPNAFAEVIIGKKTAEELGWLEN